MRVESAKPATESTSAIVRPGVRSPRFMLFMALGAVPVVALLVIIRGLNQLHPVFEIVALVLAIVFALGPFLATRGIGVVVTRDSVLGQVSRKPKTTVARKDIRAVRYRGEYGEVLGAKDTVLLRLHVFLTGEQCEQLAGHLGVTFQGAAGSTGAAATDAVVIRPDLFKGTGAVFAGLAVVLVGGCVAIGIATLVGTHSLVGLAWFGFALLPIAFVVYGYRMSGVVVERDRVYKGVYSKRSFANRREIAKVTYRTGTALLQDTRGKTVLALDGGMLGRAQAEQLASHLGRPFESAKK